MACGQNQIAPRFTFSYLAQIINFSTRNKMVAIRGTQIVSAGFPQINIFDHQIHMRPSSGFCSKIFFSPYASSDFALYDIGLNPTHDAFIFPSSWYFIFSVHSLSPCDHQLCSTAYSKHQIAATNWHQNLSSLCSREVHDAFCLLDLKTRRW